jgi:hypothetical protein
MYSNLKSIPFTSAAPTRMKIIQNAEKFSQNISFDVFLSTPKGQEILEQLCPNEFKLYKEFIAFFDIQKLQNPPQENVSSELERIKKEIQSFPKKKLTSLRSPRK